MRIIYIVFLAIFMLGLGYLISPKGTELFMKKAAVPVVAPTVTMEPLYKQLKTLDDQIIATGVTSYNHSMESIRLATGPATLTKQNSVALKEFEITNTQRYREDLMKQRLSLLRQLGYK
jgi:hypothetical protein